MDWLANVVETDPEVAWSCGWGGFMAVVIALAARYSNSRKE